MKSRSASIVSAALMTVLALGLVVAPAQGAPGDVNRDLAVARAVSGAYHNIDAAIADGYTPTPACAAAPGLGTMGYHYINYPLFDAEIDLTAPEAVLYAYDAGGQLQLVAIEYVAVALANTPGGPAPWFEATPPPLGFFNPNPVLFGRTFDGPMPGHEPGMPWHYELHVWLWAYNPAGLFAPWNPSPNVLCPAA